MLPLRFIIEVDISRAFSFERDHLCVISILIEKTIAFEVVSVWSSNQLTARILILRRLPDSHFHLLEIHRDCQYICTYVCVCIEFYINICLSHVYKVPRTSTDPGALCLINDLRTTHLLICTLYVNIFCDLGYYITYPESPKL